MPISLDYYGTQTVSLHVLPDGRVEPPRGIYGAPTADVGKIVAGLLELAEVRRRAEPNNAGLVMQQRDRLEDAVREEIERQLSAYERDSPIEVRVGGSHGEWIGYVTYERTGRAVPRAADEGGTHFHHSHAEQEARERARRVAGSRSVLAVVGL